jgi:hypothetical protein
VAARGAGWHTVSSASASRRLREGWRERHEQMLTAMTPDERHALLTGLAALARELAALHPQRAG